MRDTKYGKIINRTLNQTHFMAILSILSPLAKEMPIFVFMIFNSAFLKCFIELIISFHRLRLASV